MVLKEYGDGIKIITVGHTSKAVNSAGIISISHPILPHSDFMSLISRLENPIGLLPLDDSEFSSCKSPIKYFDYASASIPAICSNVPPYADYVVHQQTGLLVENTTEAWVNAMESLIQSTPQRQALAQAARDYVIATHLADQAGDAWETAIQTLNIDHSPRDPEAMASLVEASVLAIKPNINARWIANKLLRRHTYVRLGTILREEGIERIKKRVAKW